MKVVAHGPHAWYLLEEAGEFVLAARCSWSATEFELLIRLSPDEAREYRALGTVYLHYLAARVNHWSSDYLERNDVAARPAVDRAIDDWLAARES